MLLAAAGCLDGCGRRRLDAARLRSWLQAPDAGMAVRRRTSLASSVLAISPLAVFVQHLAQRPGGTLRGLFRRCTIHVRVRDTGAKLLFCKTLLIGGTTNASIAQTQARTKQQNSNSRIAR